MIANLTEYDKALIVLALRNFTVAQLKEAVATYGAGNVTDGEQLQKRADDATKLADKIEG